MDSVTFILRGVAGSTAHGLATPESDIDMHGVFSYPTPAFWGVQKPPMSIVETNPDESYHELEKFLTLAGKSNPNVLELLWLDEYTDRENDWGLGLLAIRRAFLSSERVRGAYLSYAAQQFKTLTNLGGRMWAEGQSEDLTITSRIRKHSKHLIRLLEQGLRLYSTGEFQVKVDDPSLYRAIMSEMPLAEVASYAQNQINAFRAADSVLPDKANWGVINGFLHDYRAAHV